MTDHRVGTREEWLAAREELLVREKEHTRRGDELARERRALPWVRVEKEYTFETDEGEKSLAELFDGHAQMLVYHLMLGPNYEAACPSCSAIADGFNGFHVHLANRADAQFMAISRAPLEKLQAFKRRMGWSFPWASSFGSDFNYDYAVSLRPEQVQGGDDVDSGFLFDTAMSAGVKVRDFLEERPGMSAFALEDGAVYHTYSAYSRGLDALWGAYQWLDRAPLGRHGDDRAWVHRDRYAVARP
jgi:predicted dithiol-disulfide oxidoreductase (DUF899 family)